VNKPGIETLYFTVRQI